jgi:glycosyltransferase involved in cell wall biosynthesis
LTADIFCLPTHSENFGIVIGEALAHGVPAICTTSAPWDGLQINDCGAWIAPGVQSLVKAVGGMSQRDLEAMGARGRAWMQREFSSDAIVRSTLELYCRLANGDRAFKREKSHVT